MTLFVKQTLEDGSTVIADNLDPAFEVTLKPGQWEQCNWSREKVMEFEEANRTAPSGFDAAQDQRGRSNVAGEGKDEPAG